MSLSRFLSSTSLAAGAATVASLLGAGCGGDDSCGPGGAPAVGLIADSPAVILTYGNLTGGLNNDCPAADAPAGLVSMSIEGMQQGNSGRITLCVGRPDLLATQSLTIGHNDATAQVKIIDLVGSDTSCSYTIDRTVPVVGNAHASGLCNDGKDGSGFALTADAVLSLRRTCGAITDSTSVTLHGRIAVATTTVPR